MAEYSPFGPESTDDEDDELESSSKSKKKKSASGLGASLLGREVEKDASPKKPVPRSFSEALNALIGDKKADKEALAKESPLGDAQPELPATEATDEDAETASVETQHSETEIDVDVQSERELRPDEVYAGETILHIDHAEMPRNSETTDPHPSEIIENDDESTEEESPIPDQNSSQEDEPTAEAEPEATEETEEEPATPVSSAGSQSSSTPSGQTQPAGGGSGAGSSMPPVPSPRPIPVPVQPVPLPSGGGSGSMPPPQGAGAAANAQPAPNQFNTVTTVPDFESENRARRRGFRRGFIGGLIVGGGIEHIRHKRRERRMAREQERQLSAKDRAVLLEKKARLIEEEQRQNQEYWQEKKRSRELQELQKESVKLVQKNETQPKADLESPPDSLRMDAATPNETQKLRDATEQKPKEPHIIAPVFVHREARHEQNVQAPRARVEESPEEVVSESEQSHLEQSTWHTIEVDSQGGTVENGRVEYGAAFEDERAKERQPRDAPRSVPSSAGEVALVASALHDSARAEHIKRVQKSVELSGGELADLDLSNSSSPTQIVKKIAGPPTTAFGTFVWSVFLIVLIAVAVFLFV